MESWIHSLHKTGMPVESIARLALNVDIENLFGNSDVILRAIDYLEKSIDIDRSNIYIVGSTLYGFSLRDGSSFNPKYSDLDIALIDPDLYRQCTSGSTADYRLPENNLPEPDRFKFSRIMNTVNALSKDSFAYVSCAVYPNIRSLLKSQVNRLQRYLAPTTSAPPSTPSGSFSPKQIKSEYLPSYFHEALNSGFPPFINSIDQSEITNSSPWLVDIDNFVDTLGFNKKRANLMLDFKSSLNEISCVVDIQCVIAGGSILDVSNDTPGDVDLVVFYKRNELFLLDPVLALHRIIKKYSHRSIDLRVVPSDGPAWIVVKAASFFTTLYQSKRNKDSNDRGIALII